MTPSLTSTTGCAARELVARVKMSTSTSARGEPPGQLDDVDVHAAGVTGARLVERRGVQADHRQPPQSSTPSLLHDSVWDVSSKSQPRRGRRTIPPVSGRPVRRRASPAAGATRAASSPAWSARGAPGGRPSSSRPAGADHAVDPAVGELVVQDSTAPTSRQQRRGRARRPPAAHISAGRPARAPRPSERRDRAGRARRSAARRSTDVGPSPSSSDRPADPAQAAEEAGERGRTRSIRRRVLTRPARQCATTMAGHERSVPPASVRVRLSDRRRHRRQQRHRGRHRPPCSPRRASTSFCAARRADRIEELAAEIGGHGGRPATSPTPTSVAALAAAVGERLDVLVNNAGGAFGAAPVAEADADDWRRMYDVNVIGLMQVTRALLPALIASGDGVIVNVGSTAGRIAYEGGAGYTAAKHGTQVVTETLRLELWDQPVRVCEIAPGMVQDRRVRAGPVRRATRRRRTAVYAGVAEPADRRGRRRRDHLDGHPARAREHRRARDPAARAGGAAQGAPASPMRRVSAWRAGCRRSGWSAA